MRRNTLRFMGINYEVRFVKYVPAGIARNAVGCFDPKHNRIYVSTTATKRQIAGTLLHELLHIIRHRVFVGMPMITDEMEVEGLSTALMELFSSNPHIFKLLSQGL